MQLESNEKPVIASDVGGLPEVIENHVTGFLTQPGNEQDIADKITLLSQNASLRIKMGKSGRKKVMSEYTWEDNVALMLNHYKRVLTDNL